MSTTALEAVIESHRLPTIFNGQTVIHNFSPENEEHWTNLGLLGRGGFGEIWLQNKPPPPGVEYKYRAVKQLAQVVKGIDFRRELSILATLADQPQFFVQFYGWYEDVGKQFVFMAMEYLECGDLAPWMKNETVRSQKKVLIKQLLGGLAVMHERSICHRDIKPANILIASYTPIWVKISDFGISKIEQDTHLRTVLGTIGYSAPEIFGLLPRRLRPDGTVYTNAVDMWSLGCVLHELLTTERPFLEVGDTGDSGMFSDLDTGERQADVDMIVEFCRGERGFPDEPLAGVAEGARRLVMGLLVPDPRLRMTAEEALGSAWLKEEEPDEAVGG